MEKLPICPVIGNWKIIELFNQMDHGILVFPEQFEPEPWSHLAQMTLIDSIKNNYPIPELLIGELETDCEQLKSQIAIYDGQNRIKTIMYYINGYGVFKKPTKVPPFDTLSDDEKKQFLNYQLSFRNLGKTTDKIVADILARLKFKKVMQEVQAEFRVFAVGASNETEEKLKEYIQSQVNDEVVEIEVEIDDNNSYIAKLTGGIDAEYDLHLNDKTKKLIVKQWLPDTEIKKEDMILVSIIEEAELYGNE